MKTLDASELFILSDNAPSHWETLKIQVTGTIKSAPRMVSAFDQGEIKDEVNFRFTFVKNVYFVEEGTVGKSNSQNIWRTALEGVYKSIAAGYLTGEHGEILTFEPPKSRPWWIAVTDVAYAVLDKPAEE